MRSLMENQKALRKCLHSFPSGFILYTTKENWKDVKNKGFYLKITRG